MCAQFFFTFSHYTTINKQPRLRVPAQGDGKYCSTTPKHILSCCNVDGSNDCVATPVTLHSLKDQQILFSAWKYCIRNSFEQEKNVLNEI